MISSIQTAITSRLTELEKQKDIESYKELSQNLGLPLKDFLLFEFISQFKYLIEKGNRIILDIEKELYGIEDYIYDVAYSKLIRKYFKQIKYKGHDAYELDFTLPEIQAIIK